jgi:hypothetical protein
MVSISIVLGGSFDPCCTSRCCLISYSGAGIYIYIYIYISCLLMRVQKHRINILLAFAVVQYEAR